MARPVRTAAAPAVLLSAVLLATALVGCTSQSSPSARASSTPVASPTVSRPPVSVVPSASLAPTPTPAPRLTLAAPPRHDPRQIRFSVTPKIEDTAGAVGQIVVTVSNPGKQRIDEIVLRWPTALGDELFLAPFAPSAGRVKEGVPLVVPWTKWVEGPGEHGEPAGTTSLGWGPLLPGAQLTIPIVATRRAAGPIAFDLQFLSGVPAAGDVPEGGDALLSREGGDPAQVRLEVS